MSSIRKIFQKHIFVLIFFYAFVNLTNANTSNLLEESSAEATTKPLKTVRILSLDGGGVRGIAEARFLEHLETQLNMPISSTFHLVGGTSAGGILATFITTPDEPGSEHPKYAAGELVEILQQRSAEMFVQRYLSIFGLFGPKYRTDTFRSVLSEYLGQETMDNAITHTAVVTYDIVRQNLKTITSWDRRELFTKVNAINATAAAISYFEPCHITPINNLRRSYDLIDGGTGANNPTLCLLTKAMELYPTADSFEIVSIGSGRADRPLSYTVMKDAGLIRWVPHAPRLFMTGENSKEDTFLREAFLTRTDAQGVDHSAFNGHYSRWSPLLNPENTKLDNTTPENLRAIIQATDRHIKSRRQEFDALVERLRPPKTRF